MDMALSKRIIDLRERIVANFNAGNWEEVGLMTGHSKVIDNHPRLLRSLYWQDEDYSGNVLTVLKNIATRDPNAIHAIEVYVDEKYPGESHFISAKPAERKITFAPNVFNVPDRLEPISKLNRRLFEEYIACRNMQISREILTAAAINFHVQGPYFNFEIGSSRM